MSQEIFDLIEKYVETTNTNIFLTGKAGTGKTTFLRHLVKTTHKRHLVVASTGVAAINARGTTIHSQFQLNFGPQIPGENITIKLRNEKRRILQTLDLLIIDEISMVRADLLDAVDSCLRHIRKDQRPFGGVQLLMIGDLHQLAPVTKIEEWELLSPYYRSPYFFESIALNKTNYICVELDYIFRQSDPEFISILNKIRENVVEQADLEKLNTHYDPDFNPKEKDGYIILTTHNYQAETINNERLKKLKSKPISFTGKIKGIFPEKNFPNETILQLKVGEQVMFIKNDPSGAFYNGKIGIISRINDDVVYVRCGNEEIEVVAMTWNNMEYKINSKTKEIEEKEIGSFTQIPLKAAWAITVHKSQGLTFDKVVIDCGKAFSPGQVYVALSRCTSFDGIKLRSLITHNALYSDFTVDQFYSKMDDNKPTEEKLLKAQNEYAFTNLLQMFDFSEIMAMFWNITKLFPNDNNYLMKVNSLKENIDDVAKKFHRQLQKMFNETPDVDGKLIRERIKKGSKYFLTQLENAEDLLYSLTAVGFKDEHLAAEELEESLYEEVCVKKRALKESKSRFSNEKYIKICNDTHLEHDSKALWKKKISCLDSKYYDFYKNLAKCRDKIADDYYMPAQKVINNEHLLKIVATASREPINILNIGLSEEQIAMCEDEINEIIYKFTEK